MIHANMLYQDQNGFKEFLTNQRLDMESACLVRIYTAVCSHEQAVKIAKDIKAVLPYGQIIGSSGSGVIFEGKQYDRETLVIVEQFDQNEILVHTHTFLGKKPHDLAWEVAKTIKGEKVPLMHVLCGDHYADIHNFVEAFNQENSSTKLVGGIVGDILPENITGYVFTEQGVVPYGLVTAALCGEQISIYNEINIAHTPISACYKLNKHEGSLLLTIENQPGVSWCREQLGMENLTEYADWELIAENDGLIRFPLVLEGHGGASRFLKYDATASEMSLYFSQLEDGTVFRLGYSSPIACVQECLDICNSMMKTPIESLFCYTCLFRKLYMSNCAEWELRPFVNDNICGVFMMGELGSINGRNEFLNGSCSFVGVAEKEVYIKPDFSVFEDLYKIKDDSQKFSSFVRHKQNISMSRENSELLNKITRQQEEAKKQLYLEPNTGLPNSIRYAEDNQTQQYNKMCMIQVDNFSLLVSNLGQDGYYKLIRRTIEEIRAYMEKNAYHQNLTYYSLSSSVVFMVANDSISETVFMELVEDLYNKYQFIKSHNHAGSLVNRFVVVLHQEDLLSSGLMTLQNSKSLQTHFLISENSVLDSPALDDEMAMIHILNDVIKQKKVIPYFQGIFDNKLGKITKYEALMRIEDEQGNIYAPIYFMDVAKKYHMYASLSKLMIGQVFALFGGREELVSINLSAYDVNFNEMQTFIFNELGKLPSAKNFVFEILEDENFKDMERLKAFIDQARTYGIRVALDDFGSGYSNFMEIVKIEPDYIKIDMSIIKNIDSNPINQKVLENISFLGKQLNAELVAEGVENEKIQERVVAAGIHYSQGFYYARPIPYHELGIDKS